MNFLNATIATAVWILIALFSKRWDSYIYLLPVYRILINSIFILNLGELDFSNNECNYGKIYQLMLELFYFSFGFFADIILLSPTLGFTTLIYGPIFVVGNLIIMNDRFDMQNEKVLMSNIGIIFGVLSIGFMVFYILQTREL